MFEVVVVVAAEGLPVSSGIEVVVSDVVEQFVLFEIVVAEVAAAG